MNFLFFDGNSALAGVAGLGRPHSKQPYEIRDGELQIPDVPGVGLEWDEKAVSANLAENF